MPGNSDVGVFGLGPMGENFALNLLSRGFSVSIYNRTPERTRTFLERVGGAAGLTGTYSLRDFVASLSRPRRIFLFVKAGQPVDEVIAQLGPHLEPGDVLLDCGNSHFRDSDRRYEELLRKGIDFVGMGVSGGYEGALKGPSMMAGGSIKGYGSVEGVLREAAAKHRGDPCVSYFGPGGSGHLVKTVHNGIEYAMMAAIAEVYGVLRNGLGMVPDEASSVFEGWSSGELSSFLVEATYRVLRYREEGSGEPLIERVLDVAEQKGTGIWTAQLSLDLGVPAPSIAEAVHGRFVSAMRDFRQRASTYACAASLPRAEGEVVETCRWSLYLTFVASYLQGSLLLEAASKSLGYGFDVAEAFRVWRAGCIIRSRIVERAYAALSAVQGEGRTLQLMEEFQRDIREHVSEWGGFVALAARLGVPAPVTSSALNWYLAITSRRLTANLVQALRDYFGRHGFQRIDMPGTFSSGWGRE
jgi:6-phosphogluconate dehydrogenase